MANIAKLTKKRLGELLIEEGLLKDKQVDDALKEQKEKGGLLGEVLVKLGYVSEADIARAIARQFGLPYIDASRYAIPQDVKTLFEKEFMEKNQLVIMDRIGKSVVIATAGTLRDDVYAELEKKTGSALFVYVSTASQVKDAIAKLFPDGQKKK